MVWAYVMENRFGAEEHSNQPVFELIQKVGVADEQIVFEQTEDRPELRKLLERLRDEDILIAVSYTHLDVYKRQPRKSGCTLTTPPPAALPTASWSKCSTPAGGCASPPLSPRASCGASAPWRRVGGSPLSLIHI